MNLIYKECAVLVLDDFVLKYGETKATSELPNVMETSPHFSNDLKLLELEPVMRLPTCCMLCLSVIESEARI